MQELMLRREDGIYKLGLLTPVNGSFTLRTKVAVKNLGQGSPVFFLRPRHESVNGTFVPLRPEEPFRYLHRLQQAHLARQGSQIGMFLPDD